MKNNTVVVLWENQSNTWWNETCANIMEVFGLPGEKYQTEISTDSMKFHFNNEKDAFMCKLLISEDL